MHGILLVDKPAGISSHDVVRRVRRLAGTRKVGHAGTLDPLATGVLAVAIGDGTKILQFLLTDRKSYRASFLLGTTTDTLDSEGQALVQRNLPDNCRELLEIVCQRFRGDILQVPPMYSALKKDGVPLYKLARKGEVVERQPRQVTIERLDILSTELPQVTIEVDCSKGTYIRSLIADIGENLGCGAHMTALCRLRSGIFHLEDCVSLETLEQRRFPLPLLSLEQALANLPAAALNEEAASALSFGIPPQREQLLTADALEEGNLVMLTDQGRLAAVARFAPAREREKRGDFELVRVFPGEKRPLQL